MTAKSVTDVLGILFASGLSGLRNFWKVSGLSKTLAEKRSSTTVSFDSIAEREEVWHLIDHCLKKDNAEFFRQVLELKGVIFRYPFLLRRALEKGKGLQKCVDVLENLKTSTVVCELSELPPILGGLTRDRLNSLIASGLVATDSWVEWPSRALLLVMAFIEVGNFVCAEVLVEKGAKVDVCSWKLVETGGYSVFDKTPLQSLLESTLFKHVPKKEGEVGEEGKKQTSKRSEGLSLLRLLAQASKEQDCLSWRVRVGGKRNQKRREETAFGLACLMHDAEAVRVLLEVGRGVCDHQTLPFLAVEGLTAIPTAQWERERKDEGALSVLSVLADAGVDLSLLSVACDLKSVPMIRLLGGKGGADPNVVGKAREGEKAGKVPLLRVVFDSQKYKKDSDEITAGLVTALADVGADMNARDGRDGHCPLWLVCRYRLQKTVKTLLQSGAAVEKDEAGQALRPLSLLEAAGHGDEILLSLLLEAGADPNRVGVFQRFGDKAGLWTRLMAPLQVVMRRLSEAVRGTGRDAEKHKETDLAFRMTTMLVEHGARVELPPTPTPIPVEHQTDTTPLSLPKCPLSPLHLAWVSYAAPVVSLLCEKGGADPNAPGYVLEGGGADYDPLNDPQVSVFSPLIEFSTLFDSPMEGFMTPLQFVMRRLYETVRDCHPEKDEEKETERQLAFRITKTLIEHGARVSAPRSPTPSLSSPRKQATDTDPLSALQSLPSPLLLACLSFAPPVVSLLCEKGGADPNAPGCVTEGGEAEYPFVSVWSCKWSTSREAWGVLDALEKAGADPSTLSSKYPPVFQPQTSSETLMGTSSLAVKLINLAEARASPLLLQILQSASLEELQEGGIALASALY
uniref:Uncharacterized protein n=1 Tax=Chromera velia CCMP2878 TaxID=1169474 RepID=A0A0G4HCS3_9ALVE|eukprot:Cvel_26312.t1-p1 / transcript=Cvel_26312.t1 / gene=Cvel_26312 / organism=Chromera_velia_CCMP2878 / gene_product=hypothetical protein / transcript_product=hypothetical protein / location=Cvel_scaffold3108:13054-15806(+) / protein_length=853 / sequence_SO=supercontig / SO=protein_coding / is_pseudo=false